MPTGEAAREWLRSCLAKFPRARIAVLGDYCLDAYWFIDPDESERSVETGLPVRRVREQGYSLGGAGNVLANLAALGVGHVRAIGLAGDDLFGREMRRLLDGLGVESSGLLCPPGWQTAVYAKPHLAAREQERIDFGAFNAMDAGTADALAGRLADAARECDLVIVNQQLPAGVVTPAMIDRVNRIAAANGRTRFVADSRHRAEQFRGVALKLNSREAARVANCPPADARDLAAALCRRTGQPVFITRGEHGVVAADASGVHEAAGIPPAGPIDPVGAGDTALAAISAVLAGGGDASAAARLANLAAWVTIHKLHTTGTASPAEIRAAAERQAG